MKTANGGMMTKSDMLRTVMRAGVEQLAIDLEKSTHNTVVVTMVANLTKDSFQCDIHTPLGNYSDTCYLADGKPVSFIQGGVN